MKKEKVKLITPIAVIRKKKDGTLDRRFRYTKIKNHIKESSGLSPYIGVK